MSRNPLTALMVLSLFLTGCASVSSTAVFYQPTTANFFPPKPSNAIIPILDTAPSRPFTEIGKFAFQTTLGYPFAINSVLYNARRSGADAVVVKNCRNWTVPYSYVVPPSVGYVPAGGWGGWYGGRCWGWGGGWYGGGVAPVVYPGYAGYSYQNFTGIDARMIVFKH